MCSDSGYVRDPEVLRYFLLSSQYRGPINYSLVQIEQADAALSACTRPCAESCPRRRTTRVKPHCSSKLPWTMTSILRRRSQRCSSSRRSSIAPSLRTTLAAGLFAAELLALGRVFGRSRAPAEGSCACRNDTVRATIRRPHSTPHIDHLVEQSAGRAQRQKFKESDRIRDELKASGIELEDKPDGTTSWRRA